MKRLSKRIRKAINHFGELLYSPQYTSCEVAEFPAVVENGKVYIVCEGEEPDTLLLQCPCGCTETIYLNLLPDTRPYWRFRVNFLGQVTIMPSIWRTVRCKSHFYIIKGKVLMC
jgi:hypothetical protein